MAITQKNHLTALSPAILRQARKHKVRECDEIKKNHFVAYVDDGDESYDVSLTFKSKGDVTEHACDCGDTAPFCSHKAALLIHIANDKKPAKQVKVVKKANPTDILLAEVHPDQLKTWIKSLMEKNKDIEISFINNFKAVEKFTPDEITKRISEVVKAVAGRKKHLEKSEIKKVLALWTDSLQPIVNEYQDNVSNENAFLNFHFMLDTYLSYDFAPTAYTNNSQSGKFVNDILQKQIAAITGLQAENTWDIAVTYFIRHLRINNNGIRNHYLYHLHDISEISDDERKIKIAEKLAEQFQHDAAKKLPEDPHYTKTVFGLVTGGGLFAKYGQNFKPIKFDNAFNKQLILLLIKYNDLKKATQYCLDQIANNYNHGHSILYYQLLKKIFLILNDEEGLMKTLPLLVQYTFDFEDYLYVLNKLPEEERKKWRTKILAKARNQPHEFKTEAIKFYFKLAEIDATYKKMIDYISSETPNAVIIQYFEPMFAAEKDKFLLRLLEKSDRNIWNMASTDDPDRDLLPQLCQLLIKHYGSDYLKLAIIQLGKNPYRYGRDNELVRFIKQQL